MKRTLKAYLEDISESIALINDYVENLNQKEFERSIEKQDSVIRRFEVIGEATKNLPDSFKKKHPEVLWRKMSGMRDVLIHEYFGADKTRIWNTIKEDLPKLSEQISKILEKEDV